jgi:hypothetical protein
MMKLSDVIWNDATARQALIPNEIGIKKHKPAGVFGA